MDLSRDAISEPSSGVALVRGASPPGAYRYRYAAAADLPALVRPGNPGVSPRADPGPRDAHYRFWGGLTVQLFSPDGGGVS